MHDQTTQQAALLTALAAPPTSAPVFGDLGSWAVWNLDNLAATVACDLGEKAMARKNRTEGKRRHWPARAALLAVAFLAAMGAAR
jgi:hypothetical protein